MCYHWAIANRPSIYSGLKYSRLIQPVNITLKKNASFYINISLDSKLAVLVMRFFAEQSDKSKRCHLVETVGLILRKRSAKAMIRKRGDGVATSKNTINKV